VHARSRHLKKGNHFGARMTALGTEISRIAEIYSVGQVRQQQASQKAFEALRSLYQPTIRRDSELGSALTRIGEGFFGIHPPPNMFASLLNSMLGGGMGGGMPLGLR
jgi:hypothetical protein